MTRHLAVVSAGLGNPSSTRLLADRLSAAATRALEALGEPVVVDVIELRPLAHALADNMLTGFATGDLSEAVEQVRRADALIAVTPVFSASYSGLIAKLRTWPSRSILSCTGVVARHPSVCLPGHLWSPTSRAKCAKR